MAIDGIVLHQTIKELNNTCPLKINRIRQASKYDFEFQTYSKKKHDLLISLHPNFSRIHFTKHKASKNLGPTHLTQVFRKHLEGGIIKSFEQESYDRIMKINIEHRDEMGVIKDYNLYLEFLGRYANLILLDENNKIIDSFKRISDFETQDRIILPGVNYQLPSKQDKLSIHEIDKINIDDGILNQIEGVSPLLEKEIYYRIENSESIEKIKEEIISSKSLYVYDKDFHIIELKHFKKKANVYPIMEGFDVFYHHKQEQDHIKSHTQNIAKIVRRELKKNNRKLNKLHREYENAQDIEHLREFGDLLITYASQNDAGLDKIELEDFESNLRTIKLDPAKNGVENAQDYYKQYRKRKTSRKYLSEQIEICENDIDYYERVLLQLDQANLEDALEIEEELTSIGLIKKKKEKSKAKKSKRSNYRIIDFDDDCQIFIGKNNIQNEELSFKIAKKNDYWFHAANAQGAHVIVKTSELNEARLRMAAQVAAYFSKNRLGSSVEVHYTLAKNISKIPKAPKGMVKIENYKSMFIDPDEDLINSYLPK